MTNNEVYRYKWIVLISSCLACSLTWGILFSVGVYYVSWIEHFDAGKGELALVGGINSGTTCLFGPVFDLIQCRIGYRRSGTLGGLLVMLGFVGSSFATNISMLCLFYGCIAGFGCGLGYYCASLAINRYFQRQRSLAEGVCCMGSGAGGFAFSLIGQYLIGTYGWRGGMLITGAVTAHVIILFQLMITPEDLREIPVLRNWKSNQTLQDIEIEDKRNSSVSENDEKREKLLLETANNCKKHPGTLDWLRRCVILFKNPVFWLILSADFACWLAIYVPFVHLPERARLLGVEKTTMAWIASTMSLSCSFGRLLLAPLPDRKGIDPFYLYGLLNALAGLVTVLSPIFVTETGLFAYAITYGFLNVSSPLIRSSAALLLGQETFPMAYSWIIFVNGAGLFIGPAFAGFLYDITSSYDCTFYATGASLIVSGLLPLLRKKAVAWSKRQKQPTDNVLQLSLSPT